MTEIEIERDGKEWALYAKGHASGSQDACSGISTLLFALAGWLKNTSSDVDDACAMISSGESVIAFSGGAAAFAVAECVTVGLLQIALIHPEAVKVSVKDMEGGSHGSDK